MISTTSQILYFKDIKFYLFSTLFIVGNVLVPFIFHQVNLAGPVFLPIYFFILIATYMFGIRVGLVTAALSPILSNAISGMPVNTLLPVVIGKGVLIAIISCMVFCKLKNASVFNIVITVVISHFLGFLWQAAYTFDINKALKSLIISYPGMFLHIVCSFVILNKVFKESERL